LTEILTDEMRKDVTLLFLKEKELNLKRVLLDEGYIDIIEGESDHLRELVLLSDIIQLLEFPN